MGRKHWTIIVLGIILGFAQAGAADIYSWTDDQGVVHMTDLWTNVPELMRSRITVREISTPSVPDARPPAPPVPSTIGSQTLTLKQKPLEMSPEVAGFPVTSAAPPVHVEPHVRHPFDTHHHRSIQHSKKFFAPFPHNVQLDPFDPNFVWVGRSRVPKDVLAFPHTSFENQWKFEERVRVLERQRTSSQKPPEHRRPRP